jgi:hypothetical protein
MREGWQTDITRVSGDHKTEPSRYPYSKGFITRFDSSFIFKPLYPLPVKDLRPIKNSVDECDLYHKGNRLCCYRVDRKTFKYLDIPKVKRDNPCHYWEIEGGRSESQDSKQLQSSDKLKFFNPQAMGKTCGKTAL